MILLKVDGTRSMVDYTPRTELDYGNLLCWGENSIGVQRQANINLCFRFAILIFEYFVQACTYHIIPAGPPDPVHNCTVFNQSFTAMMVRVFYQSF